MHVHKAPTCLYGDEETAGALIEEGSVSASLGLAAPKLGSGARFKKLSAHLAARGASNPDALAAYIGRKRYGNTGMGKLSAGKQLANPDLGIYLSETVKDDQGKTLTCPECGHVAPSGAFGASGTPLQSKPGVLRTPAPGTGGARKGAVVNISGRSAAHALASTRTAVELAVGKLAARHPIHVAEDVRIDIRQQPGVAVLKHRNGGAEIGRLRKNDDGKWVASVNGKDLTPRDHQRTAMMEAVGTWNGAITAAVKRQQPPPLQPEPQQSALMAEYGIPAMRSAAFATPTAGVADGPKATTSAASTDDDGDSDSGNGLSPKAQAIYKKLKAKGFPEARAMAFAKNSEKFGK